MARRKAAVEDGTVLVTGPGVEGKKCVSVGAALSFAQMRACKGARSENGSFYIRENDRVVFRVQCINGVVWTVPV